MNKLNTVVSEMWNTLLMGIGIVIDGRMITVGDKSAMLFYVKEDTYVDKYEYTKIQLLVAYGECGVIWYELDAYNNGNNWELINTVVDTRYVYGIHVGSLIKSIDGKECLSSNGDYVGYGIDHAELLEAIKANNNMGSYVDLHVSWDEYLKQTWIQAESFFADPIFDI